MVREWSKWEDDRFFDGMDRSCNIIRVNIESWWYQINPLNWLVGVRQDRKSMNMWSLCSFWHRKEGNGKYKIVTKLRLNSRIAEIYRESRKPAQVLKLEKDRWILYCWNQIYYLVGSGVFGRGVDNQYNTNSSYLLLWSVPGCCVVVLWCSGWRNVNNMVMLPQSRARQDEMWNEGENSLERTFSWQWSLQRI